MAQPTNGITPEVIRGVMAPYHLSPDLLVATLADLPRPPPEASEPWRHARITRLLQEIDAYKPANSAQARIAAQLLITREAADAIITRTHAPNLTTEQLCRLARTAADLLRGAAALERTLTRHQQMPASFYGTVVQDEVDLAALDATWRSNPPPPKPAPVPTAAPTQHQTAAPARAPSSPETTPAAVPPPATPLPPAPPAPPSAATPPTNPPPRPTHAPDPTPPPAPNGTETPEWSITLLDKGPGWSREVLRHRSSTAADNAATTE